MQFWFIKLTFQLNNFLKINLPYLYIGIIKIKIREIVKHIININDKLNTFKKTELSNLKILNSINLNYYKLIIMIKQLI